MFELVKHRADNHTAVRARLSQLDDRYQLNREFYALEDRLVFDNLFRLAATHEHVDVLAELLEDRIVQPEWPATAPVTPFSGRMAA
ncbi:MAG: hypothetical protein R3284_03965 [Rubricoccaceae bacterium]|nr:hypothetical protein [Rubricoccaceae bacterium]